MYEKVKRRARELFSFQSQVITCQFSCQCDKVSIYQFIKQNQSSHLDILGIEKLFKDFQLREAVLKKKQEN